LCEVAQEADADPWRRRLREALLRDNRKALLGLAASADALHQSPSTLEFLGGRLGNNDDGVAVLRKAQREHPADFWINFQLASFLQHATPPRLDEAVAFYRVAVGLRPQSSVAHNNLGNALEAKGQWDEAIACFRKAIDLDPKYAPTHYSLGLAFWNKGQPDQAIACYQKAIDLDPTLAPAIHNLAWLLATCGDTKLRDPVRALALARRLVQLAPKEPRVPRLLGVAHYRAGHGNAAIAALEKSVKLRKGGDAHDWFFLAMAHEQLGEKEKARAWYDRAVQWMDKNRPKDEELRRFRTETAELLKIEDETKSKSDGVNRRRDHDGSTTVPEKRRIRKRR
jgi:tetratricopeptide (TPR) repeat protein